LAEEIVNALNYSMFLPFGVWLSPFGPHDWIWGALALAFALCALWRGWFPRFPAFCLLALAFCWTLPMKKFTFEHDFQTIFLVGIPLILFGALLRRIPEKSRILPLLAVAATTAGLFSGIHSIESKIQEPMDASERLVALQGISQTLSQEDRPVILVRPQDVKKIGGAGHALGYALPQVRWTTDERVAQWRLLDDPLRIERIDAPDRR